MHAENRLFLRSLGKSLLSLAVSAALLIPLFSLYANFHIPAGTGEQDTMTVPGKYFRQIVGAAQRYGDALHITDFERRNGVDNAIVTFYTSFSADDYPVLSYQITGRHPELRVNLMWRTVENPTELQLSELPWNGDKRSTLLLHSHPEWRGRISEIGLWVKGELRGNPLEVSQLELQTRSWSGTLGSVWSQWTAYRGWTQSSINHLRWTIDKDTLSPALALAAWAGVALILLAGRGLCTKRHDISSFAAVLLIPWIVQDLLWQHQLSAQLKETRYLFGGKSTHEKHLVDIDKGIYRYTQRLKGQVLPAHPSRVFILHDSERQHFERLKVQYYLLPNNVYNFGKTPPDNAITPGDYILILGDLPDTDYRKESGALVWSGGKSIAVDLIDSDRRGTLYRARTAAISHGGAVDRPGRQGDHG
jgi:hypothetical protein